MGTAVTKTGGNARGKTLFAAFSLGFLVYLLSVLPIILRHGGLFFYYGDYNVQQVPFYILAHRAVREGNLFWNWKLDLGGSMIGDFAFYLWGSPFFWLTIPFPESMIPYIMPFLMALKFGFAAMTAAICFRRYVRGAAPLLIGALLYAFSGFQACNIVFQHFADVTAFFPLLIYTFDELMLTDHGRGEQAFTPGGRRFAAFALTVCLMSVINYYFFFGQIIFLLLYFVIRYVPGESRVNIRRMFLRALCGGALGVLLASFFLLQAFYGVSGNTRLADVLTGYNLLIYESMKLPYAIVKSFAMIPDIIGKGTLFYTDAIRISSLAGYLPLFGLSGVAAFFFAHKGQPDWRKRLLTVCGLIAFVPFFNAAFSLFNNQYYARWFYMPILFMAVITAQQIERGKYPEWKMGSMVAVFLFLFMLTVALLPSKDAEGEIRYLNMTDNPDLFWREVKGTAIMIIALILLVNFVHGRKLRQVAFLAATVISCFITTYVVLENGAGLINDFGMREWKKQMLDTRPALPQDGFYRVETDSTSTNYEMVWGIPTIHCFLSTVPSEIFDFYQDVSDVSRWVESNPPMSRVGLRAIMSARYYLENSVINTDGEFGRGQGVEGYVQVDEQNDFTIYENTNYIPMGFTYRYYVRESAFAELNKADADAALVRVMILPDEEVRTYGSLMKEMTAAEILRPVSAEEFSMACMERRQSACTSFIPDTRGFSATTSDLPEDNLVFFSVPASKGFSAFVDGGEVPIVRADHGMMAIPVPAGVHQIRVDYLPPGLYPGICGTLLGILLLILYGFYAHRYNAMLVKRIVTEQKSTEGTGTDKEETAQEQPAETDGENAAEEPADIDRVIEEAKQAEPDKDNEKVQQTGDTGSEQESGSAEEKGGDQ
ncbi:MAG: YfhO family protein [Lachnospiraceae bacterium]|nr:YfhO family protein [Lachnospiraceae bacterium]